MIITLIVFGVIWVFCASAIPFAMRTRGMSDAVQFESNLKDWMTERVADGKLSKSDVVELFPEGSSLRFGGESPNRNFREMIVEIAQSSAPPYWPGMFMIGMGIIATVHSVFSSINTKKLGIKSEVHR